MNKVLVPVVLLTIWCSVLVGMATNAVGTVAKCTGVAYTYDLPLSIAIFLAVTVTLTWVATVEYYKEKK